MGRRPRYDDGAAPHLIEAMLHAGQKDATKCRDALLAAELQLPAGFHQSRGVISRALTAVEQGNWLLAYGQAHQAIVSLTHTFAPDWSLCPPPPDAPEGSTCCGRIVPQGAKFCPMCGTKLAAA